MVAELLDGSADLMCPDRTARGLNSIASAPSPLTHGERPSPSTRTGHAGVHQVDDLREGSTAPSGPQARDGHGWPRSSSGPISMTVLRESPGHYRRERMHTVHGCIAQPAT